MNYTRGRINMHIIPTIIVYRHMRLHMGLFKNVCNTWVRLKGRYNWWLRRLEGRVLYEV
jgi:hypothetical protein